MKETTMKNKVFGLALRGCVAVGMFGLLIPTITLADGKGASKLMAGAGNSVSQAVSVSDSSKGCPMCKDGYVMITDRSAKGMKAQTTKATPTHLCTSCSTQITSVGVGKAKTDKVTHTC